MTLEEWSERLAAELCNAGGDDITQHPRLAVRLRRLAGAKGKKWTEAIVRHAWLNEPLPEDFE